MAHFVRNVALVAALSGTGLARTIEVGRSIKVTISPVKIVETQITEWFFFSRNMTFSFSGWLVSVREFAKR